jgi:hypothetical protein
MVPCIEIVIGTLKFTAATEITIKKSWRTFTDTATIKLPKAIYYYDVNGILKPVEHLGTTGSCLQSLQAMWHGRQGLISPMN